jgi:hypothetical protein
MGSHIPSPKEHKKDLRTVGISFLFNFENSEGE